MVATVQPANIFSEELERLAQAGLARAPDDGSAWGAVEQHAERLGRKPIHASSNDYLGFARVAVSRETLLACAGSPSGAGASRLIHGTAQEHLELERELAEWVGLPSSLIFTSGFAANVGVIGGLGGRILSDALNHASIIDGCRLARAAVEIIPHLDVIALESALKARHEGPTWVVTESYFSMDGDGPDLRAVRAVCDRFGAGLVVDEAHALGVFGDEGRGRCHAAGVVPDILIGTLGKAVGVQGAFVAGSTELRTWLWNSARSFVFSTAMSPLLARVSLAAVRRVRRSDVLRDRVRSHSDRFRRALRDSSIAIPFGSFGPIVPVLLGDNQHALDAAAALAKAGILTQAIRPPTVPAGEARLRLTLSALMSEDDVDRLATEVVSACGRG